LGYGMKEPDKVVEPVGRKANWSENTSDSVEKERKAGYNN